MFKPTTLQKALQTLPIADVVEDVQRALQKGNVLLQAEPGAGKSTGLPLALIDHASSNQRIIMLEPRRLAARSIAERLAAQLNEPLGQRIGLRMRGKTKVSRQSVVEVVTEGVLTRLLQTDPELAGIKLVIFDEFHERSLHADLGLALCLEVQASLRVDLRLLFMSATLNTSDLEAHLNLHQSPELHALTHIKATGRQHPVSVVWSGGLSGSSALSVRERLPQHVASVVDTAIRDNKGDVLVFLPGIAEIDKTARLLQARLQTDDSSEELKILRLHGNADIASQRAATAAASGTVSTSAKLTGIAPATVTTQVRRIILSTSIAETSLTIDGVRVVIDSGLERRGTIDSSTGAMRLETVTASQASATQRMGRAGRTASGVCYRLWPESEHGRRPASWQAEVLRADLASLVLEVIQWGTHDIYSLPWLEQPPTASVNQAMDLLSRLGLIENAQLTTLGKAVAKLPVEPRLGTMLVWAASKNAQNQAAAITALLDERVSSNDADIELALSRSLSRSQQRRASQLVQLVTASTDKQELPGTAVLLARAYPDWIAKRRAGQDARFTLACGAGVFLANDDTLAHEPWLSVASMGGASKEARVFTAAVLDIDELRRWSPELFSQQRNCDWDDNAGRVVAEQQSLIGKLVVESTTVADFGEDAVRAALLKGIRKRGINCLPWTDQCRQWQARVELMRNLPTHCTRFMWPCVTDEVLIDQLEAWLPAWLQGKTSMKAIQQLHLYDILNAMLDYPMQQELQTLLPTHYKVPSGSNISLRYADAEVVLSVKLQEMFGCTSNPSVAKGSVPLKVALLSPAGRPVQVTSDLANFWSNSYPAVKKDMAGRYPKHPWPDDPVNAKATARAKPRTKPRR